MPGAELRAEFRALYAKIDTGFTTLKWMMVVGFTATAILIGVFALLVT